MPLLVHNQQHRAGNHGHAGGTATARASGQGQHTKCRAAQGKTAAPHRAKAARGELAPHHKVLLGVRLGGAALQGGRLRVGCTCTWATSGAARWEVAGGARMHTGHEQPTHMGHERRACTRATSGHVHPSPEPASQPSPAQAAHPASQLLGTQAAVQGPLPSRSPAAVGSQNAHLQRGLDVRVYCACQHAGCLQQVPRSGSQQQQPLRGAERGRSRCRAEVGAHVWVAPTWMCACATQVRWRARPNSMPGAQGVTTGRIARRARSRYLRVHPSLLHT